MRRLLLASLLCACGSHGASAPSTTPAGGAAAIATALPTGRPLIAPGERMSYRVQLQGVELAAMTFGVGDVTEVAGRRAIVVQARATSVGLANLVAKVDDTLTSWIDVDTGRSLRFAVDELESRRSENVEHTVIDLAARAGDLVPVMFALNDAPPAPEPQKVSAPEVWDYHSFWIALRRWDAAPGSRATIEAFRSRYLWHMDVTLRGRETLATELGELPAVRVDARAYRLNRDGSKDTSTDARQISVWISDDADRVPLLTTGRTDYGDVRMEIVDYQPGTGAGSR